MIKKPQIRGHNLRHWSHSFCADCCDHFWGNDVRVYDAWQDRIDRDVLLLHAESQLEFLEYLDALTMRRIRPVARTKLRTAALAPSYSG